MKAKTPPKKQEINYEERRCEGIRKVFSKKSPFQRQRIIDKIMKKTVTEKPFVTIAGGTQWGSAKK